MCLNLRVLGNIVLLFYGMHLTGPSAARKQWQWMHLNSSRLRICRYSIIEQQVRYLPSKKHKKTKNFYTQEQSDGFLVVVQYRICVSLMQ